ncbi:MAG: 6,7-dimethyl-8-ribityllumazine synthase [Bacteroidetes bacterium]|nr:6,7-dimethyl-8-ribityllumazine synthase [Bacteroidota bacterium]MBX7128506.1 6,7-dimethyl-8-ribityllumazine synthase [Flavobacteriales bacterium]MCC6653751.1 6,7-dimethyl-8-ribityllumazine synthase [Flavobacteriales bacterium]HMU13669.1 6,7-dimethyl-8-ribityllumazine synthase [Flavobacteriales bacterium]HMW96366.1 6,7-dimethyl-8-ribityllumazine synthase [Flavobacteriales bacterium]
MATAGKDLSSYHTASVPGGSGLRLGLVTSEWNPEITGALRDGAVETLLKHGVALNLLLEERVPGSFELPLGAQTLLEHRDVDGVICIGSVVRGETPHFDYVCQAVASGIMDLNIKHGKPVIFCVLTDDTMEQARDRSGGRHGNKGVDCAVALLKMCALTRKYRG